MRWEAHPSDGNGAVVEAPPTHHCIAEVVCALPQIYDHRLPEVMKAGRSKGLTAPVKAWSDSS